MTNKSDKAGYVFPDEYGEGNVCIENDKVICKGGNVSQNFEVNIKDIQYVYVVVDNNKRPFLFLFNFHQNWLPANFTGFSQTYKELSARLGFKDEVFFEHVNKKTQLKKEIWRLTRKVTYEILEGDLYDYAKGFEIQSPKKDFMSWETTYEELNSNPNVSFEMSPYGQKICRFRHPVRLGNILLKDFWLYFDNARKDVPVLSFYSNCIDTSNSDKSYYELKKKLQKDFSGDNCLLGYERKDQNYFSFNANGVFISLIYSYDSEWMFNGGHTFFMVENKREYESLLVDLNYESKMEVSSYLILEEDINVPSDYKKNSKVKRRPKGLLPSGPCSPVIWIDLKNSKVGFADKSYCQVFDMKEIKLLRIQNILPAKGPGGGYLELVFKDKEKSCEVFHGPCHMFDTYREDISGLTGLEVKTSPEYHDY